VDWTSIPGFIDSLHKKTGIPKETIQRYLDIGAIDYEGCIGEWCRLDTTPLPEAGGAA
jgi:hypothetical protein